MSEVSAFGTLDQGASQIFQTASAKCWPGREFQSAIGKSVFAQTSGQSAGTERLQSLSERSSADQERRALANIEALL